MNPTSRLELNSAESTHTGIASPPSPGSPVKMINHPSTPEKPEKTPPKESFFKKLTKPTKTKMLIGTVLMIGVGAGSAYLIMAISGNSQADSWPWRFWYVAAFLFDQGLFQPLISLAQFLLLHRYITKPMSGAMQTATRFIIGNDIMTVFESKMKLAK